jgi:ADP-ribose pyrophosphatase
VLLRDCKGVWGYDHVCADGVWTYARLPPPTGGTPVRPVGHSIEVGGTDFDGTGRPLSSWMPGEQQGQSRRAVSREVLHRGAKWTLEGVSFESAGGETIRREIVRHPGAAVILPLTDDGKIVLIRNHRLSVEKELYELPAGTLEPPEPPEACARRELHEEAGYLAATWTPLGRFYTSPGLSDEVMWAYAASGLEPVGQKLEADELVTVHPVTIAEVMDMIDKRELVDAKSMLTILLAERRGIL